MENSKENPAFVYNLAIHKNQQFIVVNNQNNEICVRSSAQIVQHWATINLVSIEERIPIESKESLQVLI